MIEILILLGILADEGSELERKLNKIFKYISRFNCIAFLFLAIVLPASLQHISADLIFFSIGCLLFSLWMYHEGWKSKD